jgi:hypothetical protein
MNIINTMCRISDLTQEQIDSLVDAMPDDGFSDIVSSESFVGYSPSGNAGLWNEFINARTKIVTYTEMMQLLGKTMKEFTKSDLKTGVHFVNDRDGVLHAVCRNTFCGLNGFVGLSSFSDELVNIKGNPEMDIVEVYETFESRSMTSYLKGLGLRRIWERTEQTPAQKEMEVLQVKMNESQAKMNELQAQMKVVQAKL